MKAHLRVQLNQAKIVQAEAYAAGQQSLSMAFLKSAAAPPLLNHP